MNTSSSVLAMLAVVCCEASAQSPVIVYGVADAGVVAERDCLADCGASQTKLSSGVATASHIGVRGSEPLGNKLDAVFGLEAGVRLDTGRAEEEGRLFNRQAYVGLGGPFGMLTLGRQYSLDYLTLVDVGDPFHGGLAGTATNLVGYPRSIDNSVRYEAHRRNGVFAAATYGFGERHGDARGNRVWGISVGIERGPLVIRAAHQNRNVTDTTMVMPTGKNYDARNSIIAANLRMGGVTGYAAFGVSRGPGNMVLWNPDNPFSAAVATVPSTHSRDALVGIAIPSGATTFLASYIRKDDRDPANRDADQIAIGATYALSRRTDFYAAISRIHNRNGAAYTVGNATDFGNGSKAINIGMRHAF